MDSLWIILQKNSSGNQWETKRLLESCPSNIQPQVILHPTVDIIVNKENRRSIRVKNKMVELPKVAIPRTGSGTGYFGLAILRHLERLGVPMVNSSSSIESTKDKLYAHQIFAEQGIPTPKTLLVKHPINANLVQKEIGFPAVVKIMAGSYGKGVYQVTSKSRFVDFIDFAHGINTDEAILVQEYIDTHPGEDLRVFVVGGKVLGAMKRSAKDGSFKANISRGGRGVAYEVTPVIEQIALKVCKSLELEVAGVDLLFGKDGFLVCEANSAPGFKGFEQATGVDVAKAIIDYALTKY